MHQTEANFSLQADSAKAQRHRASVSSWNKDRKSSPTGLFPGLPQLGKAKGEVLLPAPRTDIELPHPPPRDFVWDSSTVTKTSSWALPFTDSESRREFWPPSFDGWSSAVKWLAQGHMVPTCASLVLFPPYRLRMRRNAPKKRTLLYLISPGKES